MRPPNHSFAPRMDSGFSGAVVAGSMPWCPAIEAAAARNHASYSTFAKTTRMSRSPRASLARCSASGAASAGQSSSASIRIRMEPSGRVCRAASSTARSSSPALKTRSRATRIGGGVCTTASGATRSAIRRSRIGTASTSPCPSTMVAIVGTAQDWAPNNAICFGATFASFGSGASWPILSSSPAV